MGKYRLTFDPQQRFDTYREYEPDFDSACVDSDADYDDDVNDLDIRTQAWVPCEQHGQLYKRRGNHPLSASNLCFEVDLNRPRDLHVKYFPPTDRYWIYHQCISRFKQYGSIIRHRHLEKCPGGIRINIFVYSHVRGKRRHVIAVGDYAFMDRFGNLSDRPREIARWEGYCTLRELYLKARMLGEWYGLEYRIIGRKELFEALRPAYRHNTPYQLLRPGNRSDSDEHLQASATTLNSPRDRSGTLC